MAAEDYFDFDDPFEDSRYPYLRKPQEPKGTARPGYLGPHQGAPWDEAQERKLVRDFHAGYSLPDLANRMGRNLGGITARLEKLGIDPYDRSKTKSVAPLRTPQPIKEPTMTANKMHLVALLQTGYTTVHVTFDSACRGQTYTYKAPTKMGVAVGDMLVVPARDAFQVVWVKAVDKSPKIDVKAPFEYRWVVQKVDATQYTDQTQREAQALEQLEDAQRAEAQRKAMEMLLGGGAASAEFLKLLNGEA